MLYYIENENLRVTISDKGAELFSVISKADGCEYIWQGDPKYWEDRAPVLFPVCCRLFDGFCSYRGEKYYMDIHGFAKDNVFSLKERGKSFIKLLFLSNEETKKIYPFDFKFTVEFRLLGNRLKFLTTVESKEKDRAMIFAVGGHPGFNVPLGEGVFEDWYFEFDRPAKPRRFIFSETGFRNGNEPLFPLEDGKIIRLTHSIFDNEAIFLKDHCRNVTLKSKSSDKYVRIEAEEMNYMGFWHETGLDAPYVCVEPMTGLPAFDGKREDLEEKDNMIRLAPGGVRATGFDIIFG